MIGIVVVAHSRPLAEAAVAFAREMPDASRVPMVVAAGLDDATYGTDAGAIAEAIQRVDGPAGVLLLMDLGSAVMSAELALELVDDEVRQRVRLCPAPLVEGLVVAAAAAAAGQSLDAVAAQAIDALAAKMPTETTEGDRGSAQAVFDVRNEHGLHLRPASKLVALVLDFRADVRIRDLTTGAGPVSAASLSRVTGIGAGQGHRLEVSASGPDAADAVAAVAALAERDFDDVADQPSSGSVSGGVLAASPGVAVGPLWTPVRPTPRASSRPAGDPAAEWRLLTDAVAAVRAETMRRRDQVEREVGPGQADIFGAHLLLLEDMELLAEARRQLDAGRTAEVAWDAAVQLMSEEFGALSDEYQRARAADVRAVGDQVLRQLIGEPGVFPSQTGILAADELSPEEVSGLDPDVVTGIVLASGSPTAHSAILARAKGIPMVVGAGSAILGVEAGTMVAMDGGSGELVIDPRAETLASFVWRAGKHDSERAEAAARADEPARTADGVGVEVAANVGAVADAALAESAGADAIGLVRTEFLFLGRTKPPTIDEQEATYRGIAETFGGRRITLRTLDIGADKPLSYLPSVPEANPFLGLRGIRLALAQPKLLRDQITAIRRVAADHVVDLMFPMVSTVDELQAAVAVVGDDRPAGLRIGVMVEVPSAALNAAALAPLVDFFSIGTNDLTQYALAAERGNPAVAALADPFDPAVLRLVDLVVRAAGDRMSVSVCGEMAADESAVPLLIGLGIRELSVAPVAVATIKQAVRATDAKDAKLRARRALSLPHARAVRELF
ncbi:phosphoenolpyruvate--protein phosphotransferase [Fodinicola acaciae]|uniref:phosphoenolpyruvate--protein phosphotransferase n=1 Tax=Fodinicola acaciae TaxID=2681555 RepID=UPI001C9E4456|nr:phosphoenolpyruvate--protein phosphotransferase [Fodinicola acaciae]